MNEVDKDRFCVDDLKRERSLCNFNKEEITHMLDGGIEQTVLRKKLENIFFSDPEFHDLIPTEYLSHSDRYKNDLRKSCRMVQMINEDERLQGLVGQMEGMSMLMGSGLGSAITKDGNPLGVHFVMFLPAIMGHGTDEQQAKWLARAWMGEIVGTYAQTELGHGTFLRGLETTAEYDPTKQEFVLNSPTLTSLKWWPGGLGKTANYGVVMANLITRGKFYGPHPFIVQLRDEETHEKLPGINIGEIGPKLGLNTNDNGFLGFDDYRIPRDQLLMKNSQVLEDGTYVAPSSSKLAYGTMVFVRVTICFDTVRQLQKAVTIATRYSAVRHQSEMIPGQGEPQVLDYQTQQYKLIPEIATIFAINFSARTLWDTYSETTGDINKGNLNFLPELHAISCGLKAHISTATTLGADNCRLACGGHGFLCSSGLPRIVNNTTAARTYEGENTVMWLQLARYIMKIYRETNGEISERNSLYYLKKEQNKPQLNDLSNEGILQKWRYSILCLVRAISTRLDKLCSTGMVYELARNQCSIMLTSCAEAHINYFIAACSVKSTLECQMSSSTMDILNKLCRLYVINQVLLNQGILLRSGSISADGLALIEEEIALLLSQLRPQAVSIVDAFDLDDRILGSTLGAWDGNVYQRLYQEALKSPLNQTDVTSGYEHYLRPLIKSRL